MELKDFIDALYKAGWDSPCDAQHLNVEKVWREMFPAMAKMHDKMVELEEDFEQMRISRGYFC